MTGRTQSIDNLLAFGGRRSRSMSRGRRRTRRPQRNRRRTRRGRQRGNGVKKRLFGKALGLAGKHSGKLLEFVGKKVKNKTLKKILTSGLTKELLNKASNYAINKGAQLEASG